MADHYAAALEHLSDVSLYTDELDQAYQAHAAPKVVASLHQKIGRELKLAEIHATLSVRQAIEDAVSRADLAQAVGLR